MAPWSFSYAGKAMILLRTVGLRWPVYGPHQAPREWHNRLRTTLAALGFAPSTADPSLFLPTAILHPRAFQRFGFQFSFGHELLALSSTFRRVHLAYPLNILARYVAPGRRLPEHWWAAQRVLRYLCSTSGMGLVLGGRGRVVLTGHSDASWADDQATHRSSQGYFFSLGTESVSWRSTRPSCVLSSSCEAEIYTGKEVLLPVWWRCLRAQVPPPGL
ncbi:unnamed protein product [Closterium sp. NIES-53]